MADALSMGDIATLFNLDARMREGEQSKRDAAIRFQGAREYDQLLSEGVPNEEAIRQTAHRMFYNDPAAFSSALRLAPTPEPEKPKLMNVGGNLLSISPDGTVSNLFTSPAEELSQVRSTDGGLVERTKEGWKYVQPIGEKPSEQKKEMTTAERLSLLRERRETIKSRAELTPGTAEYDENEQNLSEIDKLLGMTPRVAPTQEPEPTPAGPSTLQSILSVLQKGASMPFQMGRRLGGGGTRPVTPAMTPKVTPQVKADLANQLAQEHPDWTKDQIMTEVHNRLK